MMFSATANLLFLLVLGASANLPSYFPRCDLGDPELNKCIATAAETLRPHIRNGISEIKFLSLDPLVISTFSVSQESDKVNYTATVSNYIVRGLENYDLADVRYNPKTKTFNGKIRFGTISVYTDYNVNGTILSNAMVGTGKGHARFDNIDGKYEITGELITRKGTEYYKPTNAKIRMTIEDAYYHLDGLFDGNTELGDLTNKLLNDNSKMITGAITPMLEKLTQAGSMYVMRSLTKSVPYYKLFHQS